MGSRRLGRKRLFSLDKKGQTLDLGAGSGIKDAIVEATQRREGHQIISEIVVDLGTSKAVVTTCGPGGAGTGDRSPIGVAAADATSPAYLTQLTAAKFGIVTEIRAVVLEAWNPGPALGIETGSDGDGFARTANGTAVDGGTRVQLIQDIPATVGRDDSAALDDNSAVNDYLYIVQEANDTAEAFTQGKMVITVYGLAVPASI